MGKSLKVTGDAPSSSTTLEGLPFELTDFEAPLLREGQDQDGEYTEIVLPRPFPAASVMIFETHMHGIKAGLEKYCKEGAEAAVQSLDLVDLNILLYRADGEEQDLIGEGAYNIPGHGQLTYCGLQGWMSVLNQVMATNDLGHSVCAHLREGSWAFDYCVGRLKK